MSVDSLPEALLKNPKQLIFLSDAFCTVLTVIRESILPEEVTCSK